MTELILALKNFYDDLRDRNTTAIGSRFVGQPAINTPLQGAVQGDKAWEAFVTEQADWLQKYQSRAEVTGLTETPERVAVEYVLNLQTDKAVIELPVAVMFGRQGEQITDIRVYHSTWPLTGQHILRAPILTPAQHLDEPDIINRYMASIKQPEIEVVLALFEEGGYVREPSGAQFKHSGREELTEFYSLVVAAGGVNLQHCTATFDGTTFVVEYICDKWGDQPMIPQAGVAVYELGPNGRVQAVCIYDDVTPPEE